MSKHSNISVFVPHNGCPNRCSFCDQNSITGVCYTATPEEVVAAVEVAKKSKKYDPKTTEIAFFGGSFTAIDFDYMISLLEAAYQFVIKKEVKGIRVSTRPDAIDEKVLAVLKRYGVTAIELGAQSTNDQVLYANRRGHGFKEIKEASKLIREYGFSLGLQMMTGLYKSTPETDIKTALDFCDMKPDTVRIYPTIILKNTYLNILYEKGEYKPQCLEEAIDICCRLLDIFEANNIDVIRLGLHTLVIEDYVSGPWHPAFSELCSSNKFFIKVKEQLEEKGRYIVKVAEKEISKAVGQKKENINKLKELGYDCRIVGDINISCGDIKVIKEV